MTKSVLVLSCLLIAQSEKAVPSDISSKVRKLVRQLDDNTLEKRDSAEIELVELGTAVLNHLPRVTARTPAEVKVRLGRIVKVLETKAVESFTKQTQVTLHGTMTLRKALEAIQEQTGNKFVGLEGRNPSIQCAFENTPYWEAIDSLLDQSNHTSDPYGGSENALFIIETEPNAERRAKNAVYSGLFRIEPTQLDARRNLRNPDFASLQLRLDVSWEPRITPIVVAQDLSTLEAVDEDGVSLLAEDASGNYGAQGRADTSTIEIDLPLQLPKRAVTKIAQVEGSLDVTLPGRIETFEFQDLENVEDTKLQKAGTHVTLEQIRKNGDVYEIRVLLKFDDSNNALETHRSWINNNEALIIGANGQRVDNLGFQLTKQDVNEVGMGYLFDIEDDLSDCKFIYRTPALIVKMSIPYKLTDIDLP